MNRTNFGKKQRAVTFKLDLLMSAGRSRSAPIKWRIAARMKSVVGWSNHMSDYSRLKERHRAERDGGTA